METTPLGQSPPLTCSAFLADAIKKKLAELRYDCGLKRLLVRDAFGRRFSGCQRQNPDKPSSWDLHWENLQAKAQEERPIAQAAADQALADFIAEHRPMMGSEWIGNDHGRLCWAPFLGGMPIDQHYCQLEEGHDGNHCDEKGAWPQNVTNSMEWLRLNEQNSEL